MKKMMILLLLSGTFISCKIDLNLGGISGNRHVVTEPRNVTSNFTKIRVSNGLEAAITQGKRTSVTVEADENLQDIIKTKVENGVLKIYTDKNIRRAKSKKVMVILPVIEAITATSGSEVISENTLRTSNLEVNVSSGADMQLNVVTNNLESTSTSGSNLKLLGKTAFYTANASSGSSTNSYQLDSKNVTVKASSGANIDVFATDSITAKASSGGDIDYKGNPKKIKVKSSSGGSISAH